MVLTDPIMRAVFTFELSSRKVLGGWDGMCDP